MLSLIPLFYNYYLLYLRKVYDVLYDYFTHSEF